VATDSQDKSHGYTVRGCPYYHSPNIALVHYGDHLPWEIKNNKMMRGASVYNHTERVDAGMPCVGSGTHYCWWYRKLVQQGETKFKNEYQASIPCNRTDVFSSHAIKTAIQKEEQQQHPIMTGKQCLQVNCDPIASNIDIYPRGLQKSQGVIPRSAGLTENELFVLQKFALRSKTYFEWGSGGSTLLVAVLANRAYSVENDLKFYSDMASRDSLQLWIEAGVLNYRHVDLGETGMWAYPKNKDVDSTPYVNAIAMLEEPADMIFVDGRYRVACALKGWEYLSTSGVLMIHDAERRGYDILQSFFQEIGRTERIIAYMPKILNTSMSQERLKVMHKFKSIAD
jgi:hypothetical protein